MATRDAPESADLLPLGRSPLEVAADLRREFEAAFQQVYGTRPDRDPMLAVLLQAVASQIGRVYDDATQVFPERVIDDLIASLGVTPSVAVPSQTIVAFRNIEQAESLPLDVPLVGYSRAGEELQFLPDLSVNLLPISLRFAGVVENGRLQVVPGGVMDGQGTPVPVGTTSVRTGSSPMLLLALDVPDTVSPARLGLHVETTPLGGPVEQALGRSPWHVLSPTGTVRDGGTMLSSAARGGVRQLTFAGDAASPETPSVGATVAVGVPEGPYGSQVFVLPVSGDALAWRGQAPAVWRDAVQQLYPEEFSGAISRPCCWIAVALPAGLSGVAGAVQGITLNAITASNIEILSEHLAFDRRGNAVDVRPESQRGRFLLGVQSVLGEVNTRYVPESDVEAPATAGRYRIDRGRVLLQPARSATGRLDRFADLRLLFSDGERGNGVDAGRISRVAGRLDNALIQVANLGPSRGGTNPPKYAQGRLRLAEALRARERAVTLGDFEVMIQAFEPRVRRCAVRYEATLVDRVLQPVHAVTITVSRRDFGDPDTEIRRLRAEVERHLQARVLLGHAVRVLTEIVA